ELPPPVRLSVLPAPICTLPLLLNVTPMVVVPLAKLVVNVPALLNALVPFALPIVPATLSLKVPVAELTMVALPRVPPNGLEPRVIVPFNQSNVPSLSSTRPPSSDSPGLKLGLLLPDVPPAFRSVVPLPLSTWLLFDVVPSNAAPVTVSVPVPLSV